MLRILLSGGLLQGSAVAGERPQKVGDADSFLTRDTLTGDWSGLRDSLADHGTTTEFSTTGFHAGVSVGGGRDDEPDFGGRLRVSADLQWIHPAHGNLSNAWLGGLRTTLFF
jgi:hypothetical protein